MDQDDIDLLEEEREREIKRSWVLRPKEEKKKTKKKTKKKIMLLVLIIVALVCLSLGLRRLMLQPTNKQPKPPPSNYTIAMKMAMVFFDVQQSGVLPPDNNLSWRWTSCIQDRINNRSLVGGFYNEGDASKMNFPMAFTMTLMSWSVIEYGPSYEAAGELIHAQETVMWGTEYFLKTFDSSVDTINQMVSQIVSGEDKDCWIRPEDIEVERLVTVCTTSCSHIAAEMAAALASASIVFKDKRIYSEKLLRGAKTLYKYAEAMTESDTDSNSSRYWDEIIWGGAWLYYATGDLSYLHRVTNPDMAARAAASSPFGVFSWENKLVGAQLLLTRLRLFLSPGYPYEETLRVFHKETDIVMCSYLPFFKRFKRSKGGLIELNQGEPRPLQYAANAAFLALLYSDYLNAADAPGWYCGPDFYSVHVLRDSARTQIDYILGMNPRNMSYVVGYGERYPKHVHHRGASIPKTVKKSSCQEGWKWRDTEREDPNTIAGAMVAGPNESDGFQDVRSKYNFTEPSLPGNAGLAAALVALTGETVRGVDVNSIFYALAPPYPLAPPPPAPWTP